MLHSKNIEDVLKQGINPVRTTSKSLLAISLITPTGAPLSSYINSTEKDGITITKLKMYSLLAVNAYLNERGDDEDGSAEERGGEEEEVEEEEEEEEGQTVRKDDVFGVDVEGYMLYLKPVKGTQFSVVLVSEKDYPLGIIRLKLKNLSEAFQELSKFEYVTEE